MRKYKADFNLLFIISIIVMIFSVIWIELDKLPEAFRYGDILYHIIADITSILNNLSIGIATSIIFFYFLEFINKKKEYEAYADIRGKVLWIFYHHLQILTKLNQFNDINKRKRRVENFYDYHDIPVLVRLIREVSTEKDIINIKKELNDFFKEQSSENIKKFSDSFQAGINVLRDRMNYRYFKGSKSLINSIYMSYTDEFSMIADMDINNEPEINKEDYFELLVNDYFEFLIYTVDFYEELEKFINCLDEKRFKVFIEMLD
jgi:hypothetical protein